MISSQAWCWLDKDLKRQTVSYSKCSEQQPLESIPHHTSNKSSQAVTKAKTTKPLNKKLRPKLAHRLKPKSNNAKKPPTPRKPTRKRGQLKKSVESSNNKKRRSESVKSTRGRSK